jgi:hypothetical protein
LAYEVEVMFNRSNGIRPDPAAPPLLLVLLVSILFACGPTSQQEEEPLPDPEAFSSRPMAPASRDTILVMVGGEGSKKSEEFFRDSLIPAPPSRPPLPPPESPDLRIGRRERYDIPPEVVKRAWARDPNLEIDTFLQQATRTLFLGVVLHEDGRVRSVYVHALVGEDGTVKDVIPVTPFEGAIDTSAVEAARKWLFTPAYRDGEPIAIWVEFPVRFR